MLNLIGCGGEGDGSESLTSAIEVYKTRYTSTSWTPNLLNTTGPLQCTLFPIIEFDYLPSKEVHREGLQLEST